MCEYCDSAVAGANEYLPETGYGIYAKIYHLNVPDENGAHWAINGSDDEGFVNISIWYCPVCGRELPQV